MNRIWWAVLKKSIPFHVLFIWRHISLVVSLGPGRVQGIGVHNLQRFLIINSADDIIIRFSRLSSSTRIPLCWSIQKRGGESEIIRYRQLLFYRSSQFCIYLTSDCLPFWCILNIVEDESGEQHRTPQRNSLGIEGDKHGNAGNPAESRDEYP